LRLVDENANQVGIVSLQEAMRRAAKVNLDLVVVTQMTNPPVAKILDYSKFRFQQSLKKKEAKKNQSQVEEKEIRFRLKIDNNDFNTKIGHGRKFLKSGNKLKTILMFRGREQSYVDMGKDLLERIAEELKDCASIEFMPKKDGRNMIMILAPIQKAEKVHNVQKEIDKQSADKKRARRIAKQKKAIEGNSDNTKGE
jgi:translation initiation factor IF-3